MRAGATRGTPGRSRAVGLLCLAAVLLLAACAGDPSPPARPSGFATAAGDGTVLLTWVASPETDLAHYNVYQGSDGDALVKVAEVPAGTRNHTASGLTNGTLYFFALDAEDQAGNRSERTAVRAETPRGGVSGGVGLWNSSSWNDAVWGP